VAGCNLMYAPDLSISLSNMTFLSPDSRCYSFDERANGYSSKCSFTIASKLTNIDLGGEGFGVVVVKRLSDALANNDTIRAIIRNTGSNQDGHTPGITQPSQGSQAALIKSTYERAGLSLEDTRYFEAHGTG
jgi:acyl transferase domain-containing protein